VTDVDVRSGSTAPVGAKRNRSLDAWTRFVAMNARSWR
jgi:hypothetical protein